MQSCSRAAAAFALFAVVLANACSDDGASPAAGGAGAAGAAPTDARSQVKAMARDDLPCTSADDCCVVVDGCRATAYVVAAGDKASAESLLSTAPNDACVKCISPALELGCVGGKCVGVEVSPAAATPAQRQNHCGSTGGGAGGPAVHVAGCG